MKELGIETSERNFKYAEPVPSKYGGEVSVSEASTAFDSNIWLRAWCPSNLNDPSSEPVETVALLKIKDAQRLVDQLQYLIDNHYHLDYYGHLMEETT